MKITKYGKKKSPFNVDTREFGFEKLTEGEYHVMGFFINNKSKYGSNPVLITDGSFINLPKYMLGMVKEILEDSEAIEDINSGNTFAKFEEIETPNGKTFSIQFIER